MSTFDNLNQQIVGPAITLAAKVKAALEADPATTHIREHWGSFYVSKIELTYSDGGIRETVGYLVPDEGEGGTFDFWTPNREGDRK